MTKYINHIKKLHKIKVSIYVTLISTIYIFKKIIIYDNNLDKKMMRLLYFEVIKIKASHVNVR